MKLPTGQQTSAVAAKVSGKWFEFPQNDRNIQAVSFDFSGTTPVLLVKTNNGLIKTPIGMGNWQKSVDVFSNVQDQFLSVLPHPLAGVSGAWSAGDVFNVKVVLYQTPFYSSLTFKFDGDKLLFDSEHNVAFGPTKLGQLVGQASATSTR